MGASVEQVASVPLFSGLDDDTQGRVAGWFEERIYDPGDTVMRAGSDGYAFFVLLDGTLKVAAPNHTVTLEPGDFFGEIGMTGGRRSATVTADTRATALEMFGTHFRELQMELPEVATLIEDEMAKRKASDQG